jgi:LPXTG-site transpeptidase (sortase) family protein
LAVGVTAAAAGAAALRPRVEASHAPSEIPAPTPADDPAEQKRPRRVLLVAALVVVAAVIAVPWAIPGLAHNVGNWLAPSAKQVPIKIVDPSVLPQPTVQPTEKPTVSGPMAAAGSPVQLIVPRLQVNAPVVAISGNSGELLPPSDPLMIGWWMEGPKPGSAQGTALLTGHTVHYGGGAFDHLGSLAVGDHFRVRTSKGVITYVVQNVRKYTTGKLARDSKSLFRLTGEPKVLLITCANWNGTIYLDNTVVTGAPVSDVVS